ncbi:MAG: zinc ribbon domain-containing protein [Chloroflexi bacterium]|nr:zinc ribbon domain-containing protein [Chloroflexota bacterium]
MFCPSCGTANRPDRENCDRCGERVVAPDPQRARKEDLARCAKCGNLTHARAPHCIGCGIRQEPATLIPLAAVSETPARPAPRPEAPRPPEPPRPRERPRDERFGSPGRIQTAPPTGTAGETASREPPTESAPPKEPVAVPATKANDSGRADAVLPQELKGWNWAAFLWGMIGFAPVWGYFNRVWIAFLLAVVWLSPLFSPTVRTVFIVGGLLLTVYLGFKGNELAWRGRRWDGTEQFRRTQQGWLTWGLGIAVVQILVYLVFLYLARS